MKRDGVKPKAEKPKYRALPPDKLENVKRRIEQLVQGLGSQTNVEKATGVSQQLFSKILLGGDAGLYVANGLALYDDVPIEVELNGWIPHLETMIREKRDRWGEQTIAWLRAHAAKLGYSEAAYIPRSAWERLADQVESQIAPSEYSFHAFA